MEYVEGQTLRDLLEELERVPEELCRHIGREVAKGLAAIHEAGVVHRDLKPENVLITPDHVVKIMDLGVARLQDEAIRLSQTGAFVGSPRVRRARAVPVGRRRAATAARTSTPWASCSTSSPRASTRTATTTPPQVLRNILDDDAAQGRRGRTRSSRPSSRRWSTRCSRRTARSGSRRPPSSRTSSRRARRATWWKERAKALRVETKRPLRRIRIPRETALYGRDDDLARLQRGSTRRPKAGEGQVLLIEGEAGIGKTRLVDEFVGRLRQEGEDLNFLFGSYPPGGAATAAGAFSTAYREHFGAEGLEETLERRT